MSERRVAASRESDADYIQRLKNEVDSYGEWEAERNQLQAEAAAMRRALEFYANEDNYSSIPWYGATMSDAAARSRIIADYGNTGQQALSGEAGKALLAELETAKQENNRLASEVMAYSQAEVTLLAELGQARAERDAAIDAGLDLTKRLTDVGIELEQAKERIVQLQDAIIDQPKLKQDVRNAQADLLLVKVENERLREELEQVKQELDRLKIVFDRQVGGTPIWDVVYSDLCNLREELEQARTQAQEDRQKANILDGLVWKWLNMDELQTLTGKQVREGLLSHAELAEAKSRIQELEAEIELRIQQRDAIAEEVRQSHAVAEELHFKTVQENEQLQGLLSALVNTFSCGFTYQEGYWFCPFCLVEVEGTWEKGIASEPLLSEHEGDCPWVEARRALEVGSNHD